MTRQYGLKTWRTMTQAALWYLSNTPMLQIWKIFAQGQGLFHGNTVFAE
jgi:hypothetical protein